MYLRTNNFLLLIALLGGHKFSQVLAPASHCGYVINELLTALTEITVITEYFILLNCYEFHYSII
jgi:hypothetical protein